MTIYQDFPPELRRLSPRLTISGDPSSSLRAINTRPLPNGAMVYIIGVTMNYVLQKDSTAVPVGDIIIAPDSGPGRWVSTGPPAPANDSAVLTFGCARLTPSMTTRFLFPDFERRNALMVPIQMRVPRAGILRSLFVRVRAVPGASGGVTVTYTVRVNEVATALAVSGLDTAQSISNVTDAVSVDQGDRIDVRTTKDMVGLSNSYQDIVASTEFEAAA